MRVFHFLPTLMLGVSVCLVGCRTPGPVLELAAQSGLNASQLANHLDNFTTHRGELARRRAEISAAVSERAANLVTDFEIDRQAMTLGGRTNEIRLFESLVGASEVVAQKYSDTEAAADRQRALVLQGLQNLEGSPKALNDVAKSLAELGHDDDFKARVVFYGNYIQSVMKQVDQFQTEKEKAIKDATGKAQEIKNASKQSSDANKNQK